MFFMFLLGIPISLFLIPLITISLSDIPHDQLTGASGVWNFCRLISGGGFGTAIFISLWQRREIFHHARLTENITSFNPLIPQFYEQLAEEKSIPEEISRNILEQLITQQSFLLAINDLFLLLALIMGLIVPIIWFCKYVPDKLHEDVF